MIWWILTGLTVFAASGAVTFAKPKVLLEDVAFNLCLGATFVPVLYVSIKIVGLSWQQLLLWFGYLLLLGVILEVARKIAPKQKRQ